MTQPPRSQLPCRWGGSTEGLGWWQVITCARTVGTLLVSGSREKAEEEPLSLLRGGSGPGASLKRMSQEATSRRELRWEGGKSRGQGAVA